MEQEGAAVTVAYELERLCVALEAEPTRTYSHDDVIAIIDELLDGIKPKKGRVKK